jgi:hypothetical protein
VLYTPIQPGMRENMEACSFAAKAWCKGLVRLACGVYASMLGTCMRRPVLRSQVVWIGSTMGMLDTVTRGIFSTSDSAGVQ